MMHCVIAFVKDEGNNLTSMATTLHYTINSQSLKLQRVYEGFCFGRVMSKACQYATNDNKVAASLKHVNVKNVQTSLQKTITWTKKT